MTIQELSDQIMEQARQKGFGTKPADISVPEKIALIHSEISEAYEAYRHKNLDGKDGFAEELGDAVQRILHLAAIMDIDLEQEIRKKLNSNTSREWNWAEMNEGQNSSQT